MSEVEEFEEVARHLCLPEFDVAIIGDGSGTTPGNSCGWYATAYLKKSRQLLRFWGGVSSGTNNTAELSPYVFALWHLDALARKADPGWPAGRSVRVAVVSDSELTVRCGNREYARKANLALWAAIECYERNGFELHWVHIPRNSNPFSVRADDVAGRVRLALDGTNW